MKIDERVRRAGGGRRERRLAEVRDHDRVGDPDDDLGRAGDHDWPGEREQRVKGRAGPGAGVLGRQRGVHRPRRVQGERPARKRGRPDGSPSGPRLGVGAALHRPMARILYGVAGEGMGHAIRSRVVIDHLSRSHDVQVVVSGRAHGYLKALERDRLGVNKIGGSRSSYEDNEVRNFRTVLANVTGAAFGGWPRNVKAYFDFAQAFSRKWSCRTSRAGATCSRGRTGSRASRWTTTRS